MYTHLGIRWMRFRIHSSDVTRVECHKLVQDRKASEGAARNSNSFSSRLASCLQIHKDLLAETPSMKGTTARIAAMKEFFDLDGDGTYTISRKSFNDTFAPVFKLTLEALVRYTRTTHFLTQLFDSSN